MLNANDVARKHRVTRRAKIMLTRAIIVAADVQRAVIYVVIPLKSR